MERVELAAGAARATIDARGAEAARWSVAGTQLLWDRDPQVWDGVAPILFPVVGWTAGGRARVAGKTYPLGLHGFARGMRFAAARLGPSRARFALAAGEETRASYPFDFWLGVQYALFPTALAVGLTVKNRGDAPMPYACGLHPGLRWPFAGGGQEDYAIEFAEEEDPRVPEISADGLFRASRRAAPLEGRRLALTPDVFAAEALCFLNARSRSLRFVGPRGAALKVETSNFDHVALWSRPGAPFLCVESWTGHGDPEGFCGDLYEKPSMRLLAPGEVAHHVARYSFSPPHG